MPNAPFETIAALVSLEVEANQLARYAEEVLAAYKRVSAENERLRDSLSDVLAWIDEVGAEAKRRDTERLAPARALVEAGR